MARKYGFICPKCGGKMFLSSGNYDANVPGTYFGHCRTSNWCGQYCDFTWDRNIPEQETAAMGTHELLPNGAHSIPRELWPALADLKDEE